MSASTSHLGASYWQNFEINSVDIQNLITFLFEKEQPLSLDELARVLVNKRLDDLAREQKAEREQAGQFYYPKQTYLPETKLVFPEFNWKSGTVKSVRPGINPDLGNFDVITVQFDDKTQKELVANLPNHAINEIDYQAANTEEMNVDAILTSNGTEIKSKLRTHLEKQKDLIRIGATWFPKSLLIDISKGQLNLAEAILDSQEGGPMETKNLLQQLEYPSDPETENLLEFSMNYALQEDPRFDEVGTAGRFSWFLKRLEPENVLEVPLYLRLTTKPDMHQEFDEDTQKMFDNLNDELSFPDERLDEKPELTHTSVTLSYPHWRAGSLPITPTTQAIFPTALETSHIKIAFRDEQTGEFISVWVVRPNKYVIGLRDWYLSQNLIPGSIVEIGTTPDPGLLTIQPRKKRSNKEWIKTVLVGADGGLVFALLRQSIYAGFSDRMAIAIPDVEGIDALWQERARKTVQLKTDINRMFSELAKLNNQRHVHFVDLYAAINVIRRTTPQNLLEVLTNNAEFIHVGDHYYHLTEPG